MAKQPILDGYRILDFTQYLAGPSATRLMAEMGAEIIKVEMAPYGDPSRAFPYRKHKRSAYYVQQNRGKKSLCLDLKDERSQAVVRELIRECDVLIENYAPGVIGRLGFGWEQVRELNPKLVMCSISAFGQTGPLSHLSGFDYIAQAYAGVTSVIGEPDRPPSLPMLAIGDVTTGVHAACALGFALLDVHRTGVGQHLDISLLDCYFHQHEVNVQAYSASGGKIVPRRAGSHHYAVAPTGIFRGPEGYIMILALLHQWPVLCKAMGREDLIKDERFKTNELRVANLQELIELIEGWLQRFPTDAAAIEALQAVRVPVAPILTVPQAIAHPHHRARGTVRTVSDRMLGEFDMPGMPLRFSAHPDLPELQAPFLGEHNGEILTGLLGYDAAAVAELERAGVLVSAAH
ncbi:MAG: CoA transferase [Pseudomonadales bacterium]|nr:CoA transferase [Pseudomonadales bacterium]